MLEGDIIAWIGVSPYIAPVSRTHEWKCRETIHFGVHHFETPPESINVPKQNPTFDNGVETQRQQTLAYLLQSDLPGLMGIVAYCIQERISMVLSSVAGS